MDQLTNTSKDPLHVPNGPMTRSKTKVLVLKVSTKSYLKGLLEHQEALVVLVHLIHVQEGPNPTLFGPRGEEKTSKGNKRIQAALRNKVATRLPNYVRRLFQ